MNGKSALVVVDMVNDFVHDEGSLTVGKPAQAIAPYIAKSADLMRDAGNLVIFAGDHHTGDCRPWPQHCTTKWGRAVYEPLAKFAFFNLPKQYYDAFKGTGLSNFLWKNKVETVHLCGVCTDICVFATAMGAFDAGFKTVIHARGCATFTGRHHEFLGHMALCFKSEIVE